MEVTQYQEKMLLQMITTKKYGSWPIRLLEDLVQFTPNVPTSTIVHSDTSPRKKYQEIYEKYLSDNAVQQVRLLDHETIAVNLETYRRGRQDTHRRPSTKFIGLNTIELRKLHKDDQSLPRPLTVTTADSAGMETLRGITDRQSRRPTMAVSDSETTKRSKAMVEALQLALNDVMFQLEMSFRHYKKQKVWW